MKELLILYHMILKKKWNHYARFTKEINQVTKIKGPKESTDMDNWTYDFFFFFFGAEYGHINSKSTINDVGGFPQQKKKKMMWDVNEQTFEKYQ